MPYFVAVLQWGTTSNFGDSLGCDRYLMKTIIKILTVNLLCLLTFGAIGQQESDCILKKEADSIQIFSCKQYEGEFRIIRAKFMLNTQLNQFIEMMLDVNNYVNWQYNAVNASVLERIGDNEVVYYMEVRAPWPVSHRDVVVRLKATYQPDSTSAIVITANIPDYLPANKNIVRIPLSKAQWKATVVSPSKLMVEYQMQIDLGGSVPPWLVNMVSSEGPYESFRGLRRQIQMSRP